ncbi:hypothetical protein APHAL10511_007587 [Amanita phalloides]|nr:hypothetical protein APHAL10511_007587 [Amanita phalloides]
MAQASVYSDSDKQSLSSLGALVHREDRGDDRPPLRTLADIRLQVAHEVAMRVIAKGITHGSPPIRIGVCLSFSKSDDALFLRNVAAIIQHKLLLQDHLFILGTTGASEDPAGGGDGEPIRTVNALLVCGSSHAGVERARLVIGAKFVGRIVSGSDVASEKQWTARVLDLGASPYDEDALWDVVRKSVHAGGDPGKAPEGSKGIDEILQETRAQLVRLTPEQAYAELIRIERSAGEAPVILVDIRPASQRAREGDIGGSVVIERNVLEWRFDPRSSARLEIADRYDLRVIVFCQEGYTSSLAAYALQQIGMLKATDMMGGFKAWREAGLPVLGAHGEVPEEHVQVYN